MIQELSEVVLSCNLRKKCSSKLKTIMKTVMKQFLRQSFQKNLKRSVMLDCQHNLYYLPNLISLSSWMKTYSIISKLNNGEVVEERNFYDAGNFGEILIKLK